MEGNVRLLKALGDETRLRIVQHLLDGERCVCEIVPFTGKAQSTVSAQLKELANAEILESRRDGKNIYYRIKDKKVFEICKLLGIKKPMRMKSVC